MTSHLIAQIIVSACAWFVVFSLVRDLRSSVMLPGPDAAGWVLSIAAGAAAWFVWGCL